MSDAAIRFDDVGKMYKIFNSRRDNLLDALGFDRFVSRESRYREFWALRGISFELNRGERLGIIGRNGSGKSTLLKLVTGNIPTTEGEVAVNGDVQALLEIGGGLHPEFTGFENIEAALSFLGLSRREIKAAADDIADFTELGRFLSQPFKTYSMGMQARLSIGIATTVQPEILIIDEILGAGDAYFFAKSIARMKKLLEGGASVLLVSHALDQIERFCEETIWLDRGRIAMRGKSTEVIKAYEKFIRELDDRRLQAKNRKTANYDAFERDSYTDHIAIRIATEAAGSCDIRRLRLLRDRRMEDEILVGDAQDADTTQSAHVQLAAGNWSDPRREGEQYHRSVASDSEFAFGNLVFYLWFFYPDSRYELEIEYRAATETTVLAQRMGRTGDLVTLPPSAAWTTVTVPALDTRTSAPETALDDEGPGAPDAGTVDVAPATLSRWSGGGELMVANVSLLDEDGFDQAVFEVHRPMRLRVEIVAAEDGVFPVIPAALVFRADGVITTRHVGSAQSLDLSQGDRVVATLDIDDLLLGNGNYLLSLGLYRALDLDDLQPSEFYDYFDRSFEFRVVGSPALHNEIVRHPGNWRVETGSAAIDADSAAAAGEAR